MGSAKDFFDPEYEYGVMATEASGEDRLLTGDQDLEDATDTAAFFRANRPRARNVRVVRRTVGPWEAVDDD